MPTLNYSPYPQAEEDDKPHVVSGAPIAAADEYSVAQEQLAYLIELHKIHTKFCRCLDCQILQSVTGELLRRFRATQKY